MQNLKTLIALFLLLSSSAFAAGVKGIDFDHKDWEVACDNTRTCRAAGYQSDDADRLVSVLLTRRAGPYAPVRGQVKIGEDEGVHTAALVMRIDGKPLGRVWLARKTATGRLSTAQVRALLAALKGSHRIEFVAGKAVYRLSGAGAAAVLLKMDDFQGRVGTPGALERRGKKAEASVLRPLPAPRLRIARVGSPRRSDKVLAQDKSGALHQALQQTLDTPDDCMQLKKDSVLTVARLSGGKLLVSTNCWMGAYNGGDGYWVIDGRAPFHPLLVTTDANGYKQGMITSVQQGRGIGDCLLYEDWYWNGKRFVHADEGGASQCKQFLGGAWDMPILVNRYSKVWWR